MKIRTEPPDQVARKVLSSYTENFGHPSKKVGHKTLEGKPPKRMRTKGTLDLMLYGMDMIEKPEKNI